MRADYFDNEFYPTPDSIIATMLDPFIKRSAHHSYLPSLSICEPTAGKGHIVEYINKLAGSEKPEIYCFETDPDLQVLLQEKECTFLGPDFLLYNGDIHFDLFVMNPPFSNGDKFLLHAWNLLNNGSIVCLLNSQTLLNPRSKNRQLLLNLIDQFGSVEHLGQVFCNSERFTDVSVSLVRLEKKQESRFDFKFENVSKEKNFSLSEENIYNIPATRDVIGNMELQFEKLREVFLNYMKVSNELDFYSKGLLSNQLDIQKIIKDSGLNGGRSYNTFCKKVRKNMWLNVISKLGMGRYLTKGLRDNFNTFSQQQSGLDFTKANVQSLIQMILTNRGDILEKAITEVFDIFTKFYKENRVHVEGWKTNDHWKVNRKVILPRGVKYGSYTSSFDLKKYGDRFSVDYDLRETYCDIDKALCYITGDTYEEITTIEKALESHFTQIGSIRTGDVLLNTCESTFFNLKFFRKGTIHLHFKSEFLWQEFNIRACIGKNWLPEEDKVSWEKSKNANHRHNSEPEFQLLLAS